MKSKLWHSVLVGIILLGSTALYAADPDDFLDFSDVDLPGRLYVPPEATDSDRPVILFLHGAGESGTNNTAQVNGNINNLFDAAKERGAFLYAPQATTRTGIHNWSPRERTDQVMQMVDKIFAEQNADASRLYLTGLSMGGGGTFTMASRYSDRFAASLPIASVAPADDFSAEQLLDIPTWAFHARNDGVVSRDITADTVNSILTAGGEATVEFPPRTDRTTTFEHIDGSDAFDLRVTEWPTGGHGIWGRVYDTPEVYDWMFQQQVPEPSSGFLCLMGLWALGCRRRAK